MVYENIKWEAYTTADKETIKNAQEREYEIKRNLKTANQNCNDCKSQTHWNKLELVNPGNCNERKNSFYVSSKNNWQIIIKLHIGLVTQN